MLQAAGITTTGSKYVLYVVTGYIRATYEAACGPGSDSQLADRKTRQDNIATSCSQTFDFFTSSVVTSLHKTFTAFPLGLVLATRDQRRLDSSFVLHGSHPGSLHTSLK